METTNIGIKLGYSNCMVACLDEHFQPEVIENKDGQYTTPSVVNFSDSSTVILGQMAKDIPYYYEEEILFTVTNVFEVLGKRKIAITYNNENKTPEEVCSYLLRGIISDLENELNSKINSVVITCPDSFGTLEINSLKAVCKIVDIEKVDIISESIAAALYYINRMNDKTLLIYDLGACTFAASVVRIESGNISMICSESNSNLGGKNWDNALMNLVAQKFCEEHSDFDGEFDPFEEQDLRIKVENAKKRLTEATNARIAVAGGGKKGQVTVTREEFDDITASLLDESLTLTDDCIAVAEKKGYCIDEILLIGGASNMPQVKNSVMNKYKKDVCLFEPTECSVKGAALYSVYKKLFPKSKISNITHKSYGIQVLKNGELKCNNIIIKNTQFDGDQISVTKRFGITDSYAKKNSYKDL